MQAQPKLRYFIFQETLISACGNEAAEKFKYLGVTFTSDVRQDEEQDTRIGKASAVM